MMPGKYSIGIGDRFAREGEAQLAALIRAKSRGIAITPVWNKSFREHSIIHSTPEQTRQAADHAVKICNWQDGYFVDADHISLKTVDWFISACDFFTIDVADYIGKSAEPAAIEAFVQRHNRYIGQLTLPQLDQPIEVNLKDIEAIAAKYLHAIEQAARIYRHIAQKKSEIIVEISMDETDQPQTPAELFFILAACAEKNIPIRTIAPKFTGRFNKGVDYVGDLKQFACAFEQNLAVIASAIQQFSLAADLKLSVHSGSDKFAIYPIIRQALKKFNAGLHLKTAGTTWLEEVIGLAEAGRGGLKITREIYQQAYQRLEELCQPYATVVQIDRTRLPAPEQVAEWDGPKFAATLRHDPTNKDYNLHFRQLLHVAFKIAAEMGDRYLNALKENNKMIAKNVTENLYERHIQKLFEPSEAGELV